MLERGITEAEVEFVLANYTIQFTDANGNPKYSAPINDRTIRVVVVCGSDPPIIKSAWTLLAETADDGDL